MKKESEEIEKALNPNISLLQTYAKKNGAEFPIGKATFRDGYGLIRQVSDDYVLITPSDIVELFDRKFKPVSAHNTTTDTFLVGFFPELSYRSGFLAVEIGVSYSSRFLPVIVGGFYSPGSGLFIRAFEVAKISRRDFFKSVIAIEELYRFAPLLFSDKRIPIHLIKNLLLEEPIPQRIKELLHKYLDFSDDATEMISKILFVVGVITNEWASSRYERARNWQMKITSKLFNLGGQNESADKGQGFFDTVS